MDTMANKMIKITNLAYLIIAALGLVYSYYFIHTARFGASGEAYNLLANGYFLLAQPAISFSLSAFAALVICALFSRGLDHKLPRGILRIMVLCLLVYIVAVLLILTGVWPLRLMKTFSLYLMRIAWSVFGVLFGIVSSYS